LVDRSPELRPAVVLASVALVLFGLLLAGLLTHTFRLDDKVAAWVGAGLVGLAAIAFAAWAAVLHRDAEMAWAQRMGGDLLVEGLAVALAVAGLATFAAGVI
jgi:NADPH:quinone reductase-like Zn-dependent oxidoreductase